MAETVIDSNLLDEAFKRARKIYAERGFQTRIGYGKNPAIVNVDLANAWTRPGHPFTCKNIDEVLANVKKLLDVARKKNVPIFFSTTAYNAYGQLDYGRWGEKIPLRELPIGSEWTEIDLRLAPQSNEIIFIKNTASCFAGTPLQYQLTILGIDTVIVTGVTAGACVRHTAMDATELGFKTIIPEGTVADRIPGAVEWNLFDLDAKFADVEPLEKVIAYIRNL